MRPKKKRYWYFNSIVTYNIAMTLVDLFIVLLVLSALDKITVPQRNLYSIYWIIAFFLDWYIDREFLDDDQFKPKPGESKRNTIRLIVWIWRKLKSYKKSNSK